MKAAVNIARILVGSLFIFSGLVKAIDPLGLAYKMQEFFEVWRDGGHFPALMNYLHGQALWFFYTHDRIGNSIRPRITDWVEKESGTSLFYFYLRYFLHF